MGVVENYTGERKAKKKKAGGRGAFKSHFVFVQKFQEKGQFYEVASDWVVGSDEGRESEGSTWIGHRLRRGFCTAEREELLYPRRDTPMCSLSAVSTNRPTPIAFSHVKYD